MAKNTKQPRASGRAWNTGRASVNSKNQSRPKSNKYSRRDGTKVKWRYVTKSTA